jgi:hypothetical protein
MIAMLPTMLVLVMRLCRFFDLRGLLPMLVVSVVVPMLVMVISHVILRCIAHPEGPGACRTEYYPRAHLTHLMSEPVICMKKLSRQSAILPPPWALVLVVALVMASASVAHAQWQRLECDDPAFSLEAPEGWQIHPVPGRGARLVPPAGAPIVEVVAWDALRPPATPETAVIEHEAVLGRALDYRRDGIAEIATDDGATGLLVTGRVRSRGITEGSIFCAYAVGHRHFVIGTFATEEEMAALRESALDHMMRSFHAEEPPQVPIVEVPTPEPPPTVPPADLPVTDDAPTTPAMQAGGEGLPVGPEVPEPTVPWIRHLNPRGFSVEMPVDWEVEVTGGVITIRPAAAEIGRTYLLIWPAVGEDPGAEAALRTAFSHLPDLHQGNATSISEAGGSTVIEVDAGQTRMTARWSYSGGCGLLLVAAAQRAEWERELPRLARMAASFIPGDWPVADAGQVQASGEGGMLSWPLPAGWTSSGGARETAGELSIEIEARGPGADGLRVAWQQPLQPRFRALTPLLRSLGWREGERYSVPDGRGGLSIYERRDPVRLVQDLLLPRHPLELRAVELRPLPPDDAVAGLLEAREGAGQIVMVRGASTDGPRERLYIAATATAPPPLSATCWDAAVLRADAPEGRLDEAVGVLVAMVRGAQVADGADGRRSEALSALVARAIDALGAIPPELVPRRAVRSSGLTGAIAGEQSAAAAKWTVPPDASAWWQERAGEADGELLP